MKRSYLKRSNKPLKCTGFKKKPKTPEQRLIDECDRLFSLYIRHRDKTCQALTCNKPSRECAHIYGRKNHSVRWYPDNALGLCHKHHFHWAHAEPSQFDRFVQRKLGEDRYNKLTLKANKPSRVDKGLILIWLKGENEWRGKK